MKDMYSTSLTTKEKKLNENAHSTGSTSLEYIITADFSVIVLGLLTYFSFPAINNFFRFNLSQNDVLYVCSILLFTCFVAIIVGSILHFFKTQKEYKKISKYENLKKCRKHFWITSGISTFVFQLGLSLVGAFVFQQAIECMAHTNLFANAVNLYYFSNVILVVNLLIGTVTLVACLPNIFSSMNLSKSIKCFLLKAPNKKKSRLKFLLPLVFLTYAFAGFSFIVLHYDRILCLIIGFLAISLGMLFCDLSHLLSAKQIKSNLKNINDHESDQKNAFIDSVFCLEILSTLLLVIGIVLYAQDPTFIRYTNHILHFTNTFNLLVNGLGMLAVGLIWKSIQANRNLDRYSLSKKKEALISSPYNPGVIVK